MPEELWMEVHNTVQEVVTKTIPKKKKCKKVKWLSEEVLQTAEKRREAKGKGEKERFNQLNVEFRKISRRDKKALLSATQFKIKVPKTREHFMQDGLNKGQKWYGSNRSRSY